MSQATVQNNEIIFLKFSMMEDGPCYRELWLQKQANGYLLTNTNLYMTAVEGVNIVKVGSSPDDNSPLRFGDTVQFQVGNNVALDPPMIGFLGDDYAVFGYPQSKYPGRTQFIIRPGPDSGNSGMVGPGENIYLERADTPNTFMNVQSDYAKIYYKGGKTTVQLIPLRQFSFNVISSIPTCNDCSYCARLNSLTAFNGVKYICDGNGNCLGWGIKGSFDSTQAQWCNANFVQLDNSAIPRDFSFGCCSTAPFYQAKSKAECEQFCTTPGYSCDRAASNVYNCVYGSSNVLMGSTPKPHSFPWSRTIFLILIGLAVVVIAIIVMKNRRSFGKER